MGIGGDSPGRLVSQSSRGQGRGDRDTMAKVGGEVDRGLVGGRRSESQPESQSQPLSEPEPDPDRSRG